MASEEYPAAEDKIKCIACWEPIMINASICPHCRTSQSPSKFRHLGNIMKWIGGITAVLSLILASIQLNRILEDTLERKESVTELVRASDLLAENSDYEGAFKLLDQALELSPASRAARERQVRTGMQYVRKFFLKPESEKLTLLDSIIPVLRRGAVHKDPKIAASAVSHLAWANYLKESENHIVHNGFQNALAMDSDNVYAHSMWGSWCLQASPEECGETPLERSKTAETHYFKAIDIKKEMQYVTEFIFFTLLELETYPKKYLELSVEAIWYANELRIKGATLQEWIHRECALRYKTLLTRMDNSKGAAGTNTDDYYLKKLIERVSIDDLRTTYDWLKLPQDEYRIERKRIRERLLKLAGHD
jgi:tetratricopeptide (TPR) repeat protein